MRPGLTLFGAAALAALTATASTQGAARDGDTPSYKFQTPPLNALGVTSLEELRGRPVLVEFWGTR